MNAIEINGLSKHYGTLCAVDGLSLTVKAGECFGLLGVNGAGKTTTIKMLSCLTEPDGGDALLFGHSIRKEKQQVKSVIAVSPQETAVAPLLSVRENLALMAGIYGKGKKKAEEIQQVFGLDEVASRRAGTLSGGWQRRLSIAMALVGEPQILFLDEPTLGLDVLARRSLWENICTLKGKLTLILTTHYLEEAESLCDRVAVMARGECMALGTPAELKELAGTQNFEEAFIRIAQEAGKRGGETV